MTLSKDQTPPVNLKERIAALQQRNVSPNTHQSAQAAPRGLPSPGTGGLRDRIAKFEEKGGVPVPRGSFTMGTPQLAENAPGSRKRGELYGNRVPGLGRPSGPPVSRSGSPLPSSDDLPGPRKRCISTGTGLLSGLSFSTDEPVPALPNGPPGSTPRRNSLAVNFGSGRRIMSTSDVESKGVVDVLLPSLSSLVAETTAKPTEEQSPSSDPALPAVIPTVQATALGAEESRPSSLEVLEDAPKASESPPAMEQPSPVGSANSKDAPSPEDPPVPRGRALPANDASQTVSHSSAVEGSDSKDGHSDYESVPQSAVSRLSPTLLVPAPSTLSSVSVDTSLAVAKRIPGRVESVAVNPPTPLPDKGTKPVDASRGSTVAVSAFNPTEGSASPSIPTPDRSQSKPTFKAVVHRKVTELPVDPAAPTLVPSGNQQVTTQRRGVGGNVAEVSPTPGFGDLALLLEDAAMLELRLTEGDGAGSKVKELLATTPTSAVFQPDPRHASASTLTEHAPMPSVGSGSQSTRSVSIPSIREPLVDGETPEEDETDGRSLASTTFSQRSPSHRKYLSSIYRLTGRRSSGYMPGAYPRDSMSMSSEDSSPVTTPSDNGKRKGFGIAWPTGSPKKSGPNVSRSSSFADKIFNRNRTRSNVSLTGQVSERSSLYESSQPSLTLTFPSELSPETHPDGVDTGARPASWISPGDSNSEFSPASSLLDKDIFDAFPSVPQTLPPGFYLDAENSGVGRASTPPVNGRKQVNQRLSMA